MVFAQQMFEMVVATPDGLVSGAAGTAKVHRGIFRMIKNTQNRIKEIVFINNVLKKTVGEELRYKRVP